MMCCLTSSAHISTLLRRSCCYVRVKPCSSWIVPSWQMLDITSTSTTYGKASWQRKNIIGASPSQTVYRIATRTQTNRINVPSKHCRRRAGSVRNNACSAQLVIATAITNLIGIWNAQSYCKTTMKLLPSGIHSLAPTKKDRKDARLIPDGSLQSMPMSSDVQSPSAVTVSGKMRGECLLHCKRSHNLWMALGHSGYGVLLSGYAGDGTLKHVSVDISDVSSWSPYSV
jgi:hypothetical protein